MLSSCRMKPIGVLQRGVAEEEQRDRKADRDPYEVLFQNCFTS